MDYKNVTIRPSTGKSIAAASPPEQKGDKTISVPEKESLRNTPTLHSAASVAGADPGDDPEDLSGVMQPREGDKYRYRKMLGRGGMKLVLQVYDNDTMRDVAMALLPDISTRSKLELGKFLREARITASLEHPNIVPVHDIGLDSAGSPYFTMKLLKGETLGTVLNKLAENDPVYQERYPLRVLMLVYIRICNAIAFAHSKGIVHLDLKPENIQLGDYGEVLVLDWGLARRIHDPRQGGEPEKVSTKTRKIRKQTSGKKHLPEEELVDGTPGYMAPEQISDSGYSCSYQTDIYALGALLYSIITCKNPLCSTEVEEMLHDTLRGNIQRPSERVPDREIPFGIEAVVLKAMSLNPENRYQTVNELRSEVTSFISGFDTKAEKASFLKKTLLFIKRHKRAFISGSLILFLVSQLLLVYMREAKRRVSLWLPVFSADFQKPGYPVDHFHFMGPDLKEIPGGWKYMVVDEGLFLNHRQWLLLKESFPGNVKLLCTLDLPENPVGEVEVVLLDQAKNTPLYVFHLDLQKNSVMEILHGKNFYAPGILAVGNADQLFQAGLPFKYQLSSFKKRVSLPRRSRLHLSVSCKEGVLEFQLNKKEIIALHSDWMKNVHPFTIGIRSGIRGTKLMALKGHRLVPPENTLPLFLGETLLQEKMYQKAIQNFLRIEENRRKTKVGREALVKAYRAAALYLEDEERSAVTLEIKKRLAAFYPDFDPAVLLEDDACIAWKSGDYALAAALLEKTFEHDPDTRVIQKILALPHRQLSPDVGDMLLRMIRRTSGIKSVDLSGYGLRSLRELSGKELTAVDCSGNQLLSLNGLSGRGLHSLDCSGNRLLSLNELKNHPDLRYLDCSANNIRDFSALKRMKNLVRLNTSDNPVDVDDSIRKNLPELRYKKL